MQERRGGAHDAEHPPAVLVPYGSLKQRGEPGPHTDRRDAHQPDQGDADPDTGDEEGIVEERQVEDSEDDAPDAEQAHRRETVGDGAKQHAPQQPAHCLRAHQPPQLARAATEDIPDPDDKHDAEYAFAQERNAVQAQQHRDSSMTPDERHALDPFPPDLSPGPLSYLGRHRGGSFNPS